MRRGLMAWDRAEVPEGGLDERLARLRARMRQDGLDAIVIYTNIARGAAVWWLTGFTPYWNEGLLYVPAQGEMLFATALSKRVAEWIGSVMPAGRVVTTPKPSALIGTELAGAGARCIGVLELDDFPAGHAKAILEAVPKAELIDATVAYATARAGADDIERRLLATADGLARDACAAVDRETDDTRAAMAPCENVARLGGAEECFVVAAEDLAASRATVRSDRMGTLGATFAARVSLAYKGAWSRHMRSFARDAQVQTLFDIAHERLLAFRHDGERALPEAIARHFGDLGTLVDFVVEQPRGSYPLAAVANKAGTAEGFDPTASFVLEVELNLEGTRFVGACLTGL